MNFRTISVWGTVPNSWLASPVNRRTLSPPQPPPSTDFKDLAWKFHRGDISPQRGLNGSHLRMLSKPKFDFVFEWSPHFQAVTT